MERDFISIALMRELFSKRGSPLPLADRIAPRYLNRLVLDKSEVGILIVYGVENVCVSEVSRKLVMKEDPL